MEVVKATEENIPAIIELLKLSLGEGLTPKSSQYWNWKHIKNPFGRSPVLLAMENNKLIGVRAFMRWEWIEGQLHHRAVRAVDTATHPEYQGKGIFKRLTLKLLGECKDEGVSFVFNTPNPTSRRGYLSMGWTDAGKLPVRIHLRPVSLLGSLLGSWAKDSGSEGNDVEEVLQHPGLNELLEYNSATGMHTLHSIPYLRWRYFEVPVLSYSACVIAAGTKLKALAFYRLKKSKWGTEMRIADVFYDGPENLTMLMECIKDRAGKHGAGYITSSGTTQFRFKPSLSLRGPVVTINTFGNQIGALNGFAHWSASLGDLELF